MPSVAGTRLFVNRIERLGWRRGYLLMVVVYLVVSGPGFGFLSSLPEEQITE